MVYNIEKWSIGDNMIFDALHMAINQGEIKGKMEVNKLENWEIELFIEQVNCTLNKYNIDPVRNISEALEYKLTLMPLKMKGTQLIEDFGADNGRF